VESEDTNFGSLYRHIKRDLWVSMKGSGPQNAEHVETLFRQEMLIKALVQLSKDIKNKQGSRQEKIIELKRQLSRKDYWDGILLPQNSRAGGGAIPMNCPLDPKRTISAIYEEDGYIFKSAKNPLLLSFKTNNNGEKYKVLWKSGDDLRQDQLVMQMINLMNKLLLKDGLDLKLTAYRVLATSSKHGLVECIMPNSALSEIIKKTDGIVKWLEEKSSDSVHYEEALESFIKSCAGYCVITYLLGVGDRHLDNILLQPNGKLFHIDFGFILGNDPKPFPPPLKLCKEMIIGMGGNDSKGYYKFVDWCCTAFNILRKQGNLMLSLLILMVDAKIPDIMSNQPNDPFKNIMKFQEKLKLELTDEEAILFMRNILNESERALFPQITETLHRWAQYWRS